MQVSHFTPEEIKQSIQRKLRHQYGCEVSDATPQQIYHALALTVRDQVMEQRTVSRGARKRQRCDGIQKITVRAVQLLQHVPERFPFDL